MSRAFTKEDDAGEDLPERPVPSGPNYVTARGLQLLRDAAEKILAKRAKALAAGEDVKALDRDLRYLKARLDSATLVKPSGGPAAYFGARVTLKDDHGRETAFQIVGEDEARTSESFLPWSSPLAAAILGKSSGDAVTLSSGAQRFVITHVIYPETL